MQEGSKPADSEAQLTAEEDERGAYLAECMLHGDLMGIDSLSVAQSAAGCILSHPDAPVRKVSATLSKGVAMLQPKYAIYSLLPPVSHDVQDTKADHQCGGSELLPCFAEGSLKGKCSC